MANPIVADRATRRDGHSKACNRRCAGARGGLAWSLSYGTGRFVECPLFLPKRTCGMETFATVDFRERLPMTSPKSLLRRRDSNRRRAPPNLFWFSTRPFVPPSLTCGDRRNCGRRSRMRDRTGCIGRTFYGGLIITAIGLIDRRRACDLGFECRRSDPCEFLSDAGLTAGSAREALFTSCAACGFASCSPAIPGRPGGISARSLHDKSVSTAAAAMPRP
jgi:hypothetical protein